MPDTDDPIAAARRRASQIMDANKARKKPEDTENPEFEKAVEETISEEKKAIEEKAQDQQDQREEMKEQLAEKFTEGQTLVNAATGTTIPPAYLAMGVTRGYEPPDLGIMTMMLMSYSGGGKTTFVTSDPDSMVVHFDPTAAGSVIAPKAARVYINSWEKWETLLKRLIQDKIAGTSPFKRIALDTMDEWFLLLASRIVERWNANSKRIASSIGEVGQKGKGYADASALMMADFQRLQDAGYGITVTGHMQEKEVNINGEMTTFIRPVLTQAAYKPLVRKVYCKAQLAVFKIASEQREINGKTVTISLPEDQIRREYRLLLKFNETDDEIKARLHHLPDAIKVERHGGWQQFGMNYEAARIAGREEDAALAAK